MRLLLAEDNRELAHWLEKALVQNGFAVDCVLMDLAADHLYIAKRTRWRCWISICRGWMAWKSFSGCANADRRFLSCC